jgi:chaperonin cofactor prefoldin
MRDSLMLPTSLEAQKASLKQTDATTKSILDSNDRAAARNSSDLREAVERILTSREQRAKTIVEKEQIRAQIKNLSTDSQLKELDKNLKELGVQPNDNILFRAAGQFLNSETFKNVKGYLNTTYKKLFK